MNLTRSQYRIKIQPTASKYAVEVDSSKITGTAIAMCRLVYGFFIAYPFMVGVLRGLIACRFQYAVYQLNTFTAQKLIVFGCDLIIIILDSIMPNSNVLHLSPANNQIPFDVPQPEGELLPLEELILNLPEFLEIAVSYILSDFNYNKYTSSNTAVAIRILATTADRLNTQLENCNE